MEQESAMIKRHLLQKGFTAAELLVTLFIGSVFLFAGSQLYIQVTRDGDEVDTLMAISNIAYKKAQEAGVSVSKAFPAGCVAASESSPAAVSQNVPDIGNVSFQTTVRCPMQPSVQANLFHVKVTATYKLNSRERVVQHAVYAN